MPKSEICEPVYRRVAMRVAKKSPYNFGVGLVVPFDFELDYEYWQWLPAGVPLHITRTPRIENTAVTVDLAKEVSDEVAVTAAIYSLLASQPRSVGYACTSGSFVAGMPGEQQLQQSMVRAGAATAVTTSGALVYALQALGVRRLAVATPYNASLSRLLVSYLAEGGFATVSCGYLDQEAGIAHVGKNAIRRLARQIDHPEADALFFSCTNLRTFDLIEALEHELGKPVLSANQVTVWAMLQQAGIPLPSVKQHLFRAQ